MPGGGLTPESEGEPSRYGVDAPGTSYQARQTINKVEMMHLVESLDHSLLPFPLSHISKPTLPVHPTLFPESDIMRYELCKLSPECKFVILYFKPMLSVCD